MDRFKKILDPADVFDDVNDAADASGGWADTVGAPLGKETVGTQSVALVDFNLDGNLDVVYASDGKPAREEHEVRTWTAARRGHRAITAHSIAPGTTICKVGSPRTARNGTHVLTLTKTRAWHVGE